MTYTTFLGLLHGLDGYIDEISSYTVNRRDTLFPALPLELREMIYEKVFYPLKNNYPTWWHTCTHGYRVHVAEPSFVVPSLLKVNQATWIDSGLYFVRNTEFQIMWQHSQRSLQRFLRAFPGNQGFESVRRLCYPLFYQQRRLEIGPQTFLNTPNAFLSFTLECPGLSELCIKFTISSLIKTKGMMFKMMQPHFVETTDGLESVHLFSLQDLIIMHDLEAIFDSKSLNKITIMVYPRIHLFALNSMASELVDCTSLMERLAQWLRDGFSERGRDVTIVIQEVNTQGLHWG
ncbi:hypothetical protein BS50DRAFT_583985 [Corynespora cassiicola Philippines]|uniref:Uncharacterized protein n=1 Tax=Corynespora cassiicola Philippines TaxID=1448308 RepID=A0A2T2P439_CORCC|nr:hypothetical protein BS50DRAFT_583985 [Corynespora cassiicola Philippines]